MYKGTAASPGIALGKALVVKNSKIVVNRRNISNIEAEVEILRKAIDTSIDELTRVKEKVSKELGDEEAEIFTEHLMVLEDPELIGSTISKIIDEKVNADYALNEIKEMFIDMFEAMDNQYMRERAADIKDVTNRVLRHILGIKVVDLANIDEEVVLIAHDLTPSDTATMNKEKVVAFLTDVGGRTSHTAIMARSLEIAAVVGLNDITARVKNGDYVVFNGETGEVIINPDEQTKRIYIKLKEEFERYRRNLAQVKGHKSVTKDIRFIELAGNIGTPEDVEGLLKNDAEGVGLYRTEFLYMNRDTLPTEEEQYKAYKAVLEEMDGKPVIVRTLDIGGDKELNYLDLDKEMNPSLGYRAIRICLDRVDLFKTQLRALARASMHGKLRVMFPMISSLDELLNCKKIIKEVMKELDEEGIVYNRKDVEIGMMIEVPSAVMISDILAKHVDFFSIGTNDLIQYTCAVDRMNQKIHHLYDQFHPAVLRMIKIVIDNAHKEGKWVGMCGESAGNLKMIPLLLGMGIDELSMSPISILPARQLIKTLNYDDMKELADKVLCLGTSDEIVEYMDKVLKK
ncbi:phosphoenolpyruvate--protein phosphotransferase [Romboutsia maritimum]|uniref:Phosphoenolpyruvate-protein phosphotransferase n=1 Tax=Romboutsia maritimum TaxID=2020948 RepID=A0A371IWY3_9FIRM|nr:phosphoenolpyruvate--protein phosphotransferase [Romboutsia maritimum]RDY24992.1 phosphoenolpyruvate--protein phosphotransferase [Romboutsia maritimum]